ncbi:hypothetical protein C6558_22575 [Ensifer sp. NM-2]|nr:hypothetical protein [Ensifer canadensis]PSS62352.1 hypothetical protein C6558_22575 [Ensifer sp. NM-2]
MQLNFKQRYVVAHTLQRQDIHQHFQILPTQPRAKSASPFVIRTMGSLIENSARQDLRVLPCACFLPSDPMVLNRVDEFNRP